MALTLERMLFESIIINDNITLNADGSGEYDGTIIANAGVHAYGNGSIPTWKSFQVFDSNDSNRVTAAIYADGSARFGGTLNASDAKITLNASGSADFTGRVTVKRDSDTDAGLSIQKSNGTNVHLLYGNGNATFAENQITFAGADGSAVFAGNVQSGGNPFAGNNTTVGSRLGSNGELGLRNASGAQPVFQGFVSGTAAATSVINANGSAQFAGVVTFNGEYTKHVGYQFIEPTGNNAGSYYYGTDTSSTSAIRVHPDSTGATSTILLNFDGSAEFAGDVAVGGSDGNQTVTGVYLNADGYVASTADGTNNVWNGYQKDTAGQTSTITADGQAFFNARVSGTMTDIDSTGSFNLKHSNFWTVAGPTLSNPSNRSAGQTGVFYCTGEVNSFGNHYSFPGGVTPTIPANSVVPYFVDAAEKIRLGLATEAFV